MPISFYFQPSFERSIKALGSKQKKTIGLLLEALQVYCATNCNLEKAQNISPRFFYKQLRKPYYEAGIERNLRIIIRHEQEKRTAILAGSHDQIKRFLGSV